LFYVYSSARKATDFTYHIESIKEAARNLSFHSNTAAHPNGIQSVTKIPLLQFPAVAPESEPVHTQPVATNQRPIQRRISNRTTDKPNTRVLPPNENTSTSQLTETRNVRTSRKGVAILSKQPESLPFMIKDNALCSAASNKLAGK